MLLPHENVLLVFKNIFIRLNRMSSVSSFNQHTNSIGFVTWQTFLWVCFFLPSFLGNSKGGNRSCWWSRFRFSWDWHPNVSALGRAAFLGLSPDHPAGVNSTTLCYGREGLCKVFITAGALQSWLKHSTDTRLLWAHTEDPYAPLHKLSICNVSTIGMT